MSFSLQQKQEIANQQIKSLCCRRSFINGILFAKGIADSNRVTLSLDGALPLDLVSLYIKDNFGKTPETITLSNGGRRKTFIFDSPAASRYINSFANEDVSPIILKCDLCLSHFWRGVFFACGRVSDPKKQYRLELSPQSNIKKMQKMLSDSGLNFSIANQKGNYLLYTGNSSVIEDFFAASGMNNTAFSLMNTKIEGELKNSVNRIRNCETNNIDKSVSASARQSAAIEALDEANLLSMLPDELETTAKMRLKFRDYSLARLAAEFTPPISKPGLSHRLNKIMEIADRLLAKEKE